MLWCSLAGSVWADSATNRIFAIRAEKALLLAQQNYQAATNSTTNALALAQACFTLAELATNDTQRAQVSRRGIEVCRQWLARAPNSAPGHYYLAMNLGQLAKAEAPSVAAYRLSMKSRMNFTPRRNSTFAMIMPARPARWGCFIFKRRVGR